MFSLGAWAAGAICVAAAGAIAAAVAVWLWVQELARCLDLRRKPE